MNAQGAQVTTTITARYAHLNAETMLDFAEVLKSHNVLLAAPVQVKEHFGQRDQPEGVTITCLVAHS